jgi:hypothetical protein
MPLLGEEEDRRESKKGGEERRKTRSGKVEGEKAKITAVKGVTPGPDSPLQSDYT